MAQGGPETLGEFIWRQRELHELSMRQVAEMAGISNPYLSQIERGLRAPSQRVVDAIARSLETSADALYEQAGLNPDEEPEEAPGVRAAIEADRALTPRQRQVLQLIAEGQTMKEIAAHLNISPRTAESHKYDMMQQLGVQTTAELIQHAIRLKLIAV